jgi:phosphotransferase system  glucose/maltose/N-acetylglucosamine-specific IIC component
VCFRVWEGGFENNNNNEIVAKGVVTIINITHAFKTNDARKMVRSQYEVIINLFLLAAFVAFVAFLSHPTISKEYNQ